VPAAAVIPAPVAYIKVVAVKTLVVVISCIFMQQTSCLPTLKKIERFQQVVSLAYVSMVWICMCKFGKHLHFDERDHVGVFVFIC
jgi:hypothetical protein